MTRYSVEYGFLYFAENMGKVIDKNISEILCRKCNLKLIDLAKQSARGAFKTTSKRSI